MHGAIAFLNTYFVTDRLPLEETAAAFEKAIHEKNRTLKIVIQP